MYYFWDNWQLYHKCIFDGDKRLIYVSYGTTDIDIRVDVYSDWKEWVAQEDNTGYTQAIRTIGGDPLGDGKYTGDIYFLTNGWRLVVDLTQVRITGTLYSDDYDTAYCAPLGPGGSLVPLYPAVVSQLVQTVQVPVNVVTGDPTTIAARVWDALLTNHLNAGTFGQFLQNVPAQTAALVPTPPSADAIANAVWEEPAMDHLSPGSIGEMVTQIKADTGSVAISNAALTSLVNTLLKYERNRTKIDTVNKQMIIYDDDCTTVLHTFNLRDANGNPSVAEVCERVPTFCP